MSQINSERLLADGALGPEIPHTGREQLRSLPGGDGRTSDDLVTPRRRAKFASSASLPRVALMIADTLILGLSMLSAFVAWFALTDRSRELSSVADHTIVAALVLPIWIVFFHHYRLYTAREVVSAPREFEAILHAAVAGTLAIAIVGFALQIPVARGWVVMSGVLAAVFCTVERAVARQVFAGLRRRGRMSRPVVIIGANSEGVALCRVLTDDRSLGYHVLGFVDDHLSLGERPSGEQPVLARVEQTLQTVRALGANGVVVATTAVDTETSNCLARSLTEAGVHVEMSSSLHDIAAGRVTAHGLGPFAMLYVNPTPSAGWRVLAKRGLDIAFSVVGLVVLCPFLALAALAIMFESPGPALFRQRRVGRDGRLFYVFKLRTMVPGAEALKDELAQANEAEGPLFKMRRDPRVTHVGWLLRRFCIDEVPQLWNVLRGEMSVVGPRPAIPCEMLAWSDEVYKRLRVRPGLTGMWQVERKAGHSFDEYVRLDLYYVDNWSLGTDVGIIAKTIPAVLSRTTSAH